MTALKTSLYFSLDRMLKTPLELVLRVSKDSLFLLKAYGLATAVVALGRIV